MKLKARGEGGEQGGLTVDENEDEGGSGSAVSELGGSWRFSVRRLRLPRARASARVERGRQQGGGDGV